LEPALKGSLPTAFAPEYKGLTKRNSPLKKEPRPLPL
jgi:hypothetical protein